VSVIYDRNFELRAIQADKFQYIVTVHISNASKSLLELCRSHDSEFVEIKDWKYLGNETFSVTYIRRFSPKGTFEHDWTAVPNPPTIPDPPPLLEIEIPLPRRARRNIL